MADTSGHAATGPTVGVRELRQNFGAYLQRVKDGETLTITKRGREIARFEPTPTDARDEDRRSRHGPI
jgi:antitoxin (DNA-binding transcriptional repressor) of toxin-antitoxin stability system